jgi:hypothetical protein
MVHEAARHAEDRALDGQRRCQLATVDLTVLGLWRLLLVDHAPHLVEDLSGDQPGDQAAEEADRQEKQLHDLSSISGCPSARPARGPGSARNSLTVRRRTPYQERERSRVGVGGGSRSAPRSGSVVTLVGCVI